MKTYNIYTPAATGKRLRKKALLTAPNIQILSLISAVDKLSATDGEGFVKPTAEKGA